MKNVYLELKQKQEREFNNFPMVFAFSNTQFAEAMKKLGLTENDTDKIYSIGGGGFIKKTDSQNLTDLMERHDKEMKEAIEADTTGEGFIYDMFDYELGNHEFGYTWDLEPTLRALGLTIEEVEADKKLLHGLKKAKSNY